MEEGEVQEEEVREEEEDGEDPGEEGQRKEVRSRGMQRLQQDSSRGGEEKGSSEMPYIRKDAEPSGRQHRIEDRWATVLYRCDI